MKVRTPICSAMALCAVAAVAVLSQAADLRSFTERLLKPSPEGSSLAPMLDISEEEEIRVGKQVAENLLGAAPLVADEGLQRYVNKVGRWVSLQTERPDLPWRFGVIQSADVNAFSAPGGYVLVTDGLYRLLGDESELAGVLAHEAAHVIKRHYVDLMRKQSAVAFGTSLLERRLAKDRTQLLKSLVGNGAEIFARSLDKGAEFEADRTAVVLAARAGYDPYGFPSVLQKLAALGAESGSLELLYKTHPRPNERLSKLFEAMGDGLARYEKGGSGGRLYPRR